MRLRKDIPRVAVRSEAYCVSDFYFIFTIESSGSHYSAPTRLLSLGSEEFMLLFCHRKRCVLLIVDKKKSDEKTKMLS